MSGERTRLFEVLSRLMDEFPEAAAVFADHTYEDCSGVCIPNHHEAMTAFHRLRAVPVLRRVGPARLYGRPLHAALLRGNLLQQPWMVRREAFFAVGGRRTRIRYCEDWDLYLRVTRRYPVALSDEVIARHIIEGTNLHLTKGQESMHMRVLRRELHVAASLSGNALACRRA